MRTFHLNQKNEPIVFSKDEFFLFVDGLKNSVPYQHYTNSIKNFFSQSKHYLKLNKPSSTFSQITNNVKNALKNIKKENYKNYIENSYKKKETQKYSKKKYSSRRKKLKKYKD